MRSHPLIRSEVVTTARQWLGTPYRHQASLRGVGCDCLGLVRGVWRDLIGPEPEEPPPYTQSWAESGADDALAAAGLRHLMPHAIGEASSGDVLLFRWREHLSAKHCAILTEAGTIIHAHDGAAVTEVAFTPWWRRHLAHAFSFPGTID